MSNWIDYRSLRSQLSFAEVLKHYGVQARIKGERATALCPLPNHPAHADGGKRTASLSINLTRNIFQCFGCKASGNVLDFCIRMEGADPADPKQFRSAAINIAEAFRLNVGGKKESDSVARPASTKNVKPESGTKLSKPPSVGTSLPVIVNAPLDFELKHLDPTHPYLRKRVFTPETIAYFGVGFCGKGMMKDRIAIPLHNTEGKLIGYAGRIVDDEMISDECPKYLFPGTRERDGKRYEFHKSDVMFNLNRVKRPANELIVVEGFASVFWLHQHGFRNAVALMGSSLSEIQRELILDALEPDGRLTIMTDGDEAGNQCAVTLLTDLAPYHFLRWAKLDAGQPTDLSAEELASHLSG